MKWLLVLALTTACYDEPKPVCGFRCGPAAECPADYTCATDGRCHLKGSDPGLVCGTVDAAVPDAVDASDAAADASVDAAMPDALEPDALLPDAVVPDVLAPVPDAAIDAP